MRSAQTDDSFPLASVKPLERLLQYRAHCVAAVQDALRTGPMRRRDRSPVSNARLEPYGDIEGLAYARCPESGSLFLVELPEARGWARLLAELNQYRHSPDAFYSDIAQSRVDHVYAPKLEWIRETLRLQGIRRPRLLEGVTPPSHLTGLLSDSGLFEAIVTVDETALAGGTAQPTAPVQAAVLLESLDRVDDPVALLHGVREPLEDGGLLFVTALVCSGFDFAVLGLRNLYLYPPDRANCFSLEGLSTLMSRAGFALLEVSTPGVLDVEVVLAHLRLDPSLPLSMFERQVVNADAETRAAFQAFLQQQGLSSFARLVARKEP